ncbi:hypothetical protein [Halopseudomonas laoshanensis]|uniref:hypothetical protein n=1 Tax=Halopseudomonas laoshanensis TaxID=2268758 RepID=UPI0011EDFCE9|nr:hypothetical protein [Halopseudomonas laoshanensis]
MIQTNSLLLRLVSDWQQKRGHPKRVKVPLLAYELSSIFLLLDQFERFLPAYSRDLAFHLGGLPATGRLFHQTDAAFIT